MMYLVFLSNMRLLGKCKWFFLLTKFNEFKWIGYFLNKDKNQFLMGDSSYAEDIHDSY